MSASEKRDSAPSGHGAGADMSRRPDFLVVGAPKCGTTSLYSYFEQSPYVYVPRKELHFFGSDLEFSLATPSREEYEQYFLPAGDRITGDVDVWYLYSHCAAEEIRRYIPDARIIIMLRNPVDFMYSMHSQAVFSREEPEESFAKALRLEDHRRRGELLPRRPYVKHAIFYRDLARFSQQIDRYRAVFPPDQLQFLLLDDLAEDPKREWGRVCDFLGIPDDGVSRFEPVNANKRLRWPILAGAEAYFRRAVVAALRLDRFPKGLKEFGKRSLRRLEQFNTRYERRPPLDTSFRSALLAEFEGEIQMLESLLDRNLPHWRQ